MDKPAILFFKRKAALHKERGFTHHSQQPLPAATAAVRTTASRAARPKATGTMPAVMPRPMLVAIVPAAVRTTAAPAVSVAAATVVAIAVIVAAVAIASVIVIAPVIVPAVVAITAAVAALITTAAALGAGLGRKRNRTGSENEGKNELVHA